jgi:hypothetical protein
LRALLLAFLCLTSCIPLLSGGSVDYIDFVRWNGIDYQNSFASVGRAIAETDLGPEFFRVKHMLSESGTSAYHQVEDGDAAYVPTGSPVYKVNGYAGTFRVAARRNDGRLVLYEARTNPTARVGRDLLDIEGKVWAIALLDEKRGATVVARISDPNRVDALVRLVLEGPIDASMSTTPGRWTTFPSRGPGEPTPEIRPSPSSAMLAFELKDGTASVRGYDLTTSVIQPNLFVAGTFRDAIAQLVASAPTPTPAPTTVNLAMRYGLARATSVTVKRPVRPFAGDTAAVAAFAAALDQDMPARRSEARPPTDVIVIFSFADHSVSLVYEAATQTLSVVLPDDELTVNANPTIRALLER